MECFFKNIKGPTKCFGDVRRHPIGNGYNNGKKLRFEYRQLCHGHLERTREIEGISAEEMTSPELLKFEQELEEL